MAPASALILAAGLMLACIGSPSLAADSDRIVKEVRIPKGESSAQLKGTVKGRQYVDYRLRAAAGQRLEVSLEATNGANYFNLLPPGSVDVGMYNGSIGGNRYEGVLPDDGVYLLRVYLMRNEARRNHASSYTLSVRLSGQPFAAVSSKVDALVAGTRFHAKTQVDCEPKYSEARACAAGVVRRGNDGTATVELSWAPDGKRRILFVKGTPVSSDAMATMTFARSERGWKVTFGGDEHFFVPEPLVFGG